MRADVYFSLDVEADGPIPGPYSMVSLGLAVAGPAPTGCSLPADPTATRSTGSCARSATTSCRRPWRCRAWTGRRCWRRRRPGRRHDRAQRLGPRTAGDGRPVIVAYPAVFDWMFLYWYLLRFTGDSVFGHSGCLDIKTLYAIRAGVPIGAAVKRRMPATCSPSGRHTHHALDDAIEQAELFANLMAWRP